MAVVAVSINAATAKQMRCNGMASSQIHPLCP
jgi:hypothetical protein